MIPASLYSMEEHLAGVADDDAILEDFGTEAEVWVKRPWMPPIVIGNLYELVDLYKEARSGRADSDGSTTSNG